MEEVQATVDRLESGTEVRSITRSLRRASIVLHSWDHTQVVSLANTGVSFASMATVGVGARAVHSGLRSLRVQAPRVGTSTHVHHADQLAKLADSLPISPHSLFGEGLQPVIAKAASSARSYADMADGFVQAGLVRPRPPVLNRPRDGHKRKRVDSHPSFRPRSYQPSTGWHNKSSSKGRKPQRNRMPRAPNMPSKVPKPFTGQKTHSKGKFKGKGRGGKEPKST